MYKFLSFTFAFVALSFLLDINKSFAQEKLVVPDLQESVKVENDSTTTSSLSISPAILELILDPGNTIETEVVLINGSRFPLPIKATVQKFDLNEDVIDNSDKKTLEIYDASSWFRIDPSEFIIQPGEEKSIKVSIDTPRRAEPGGHYATIFFQPLIPQDLVSQSSTQLTTKVGALVLTIVKGDIVEKASLHELRINNFYRNGPIDAQVLISNTGNIHALPSGNVYIKNYKGTTVETLPIVPSSVLPNTIKSFNVTWDEKFPFGKYYAIAEIKYGNQNVELISKEMTFWVIPWIRISVFVILLTVVSVFFKLTYRNINKALKVLFSKDL